MQGDEKTDCPAPYSALHIYINEIRDYIKLDRSNRPMSSIRNAKFLSIVLRESQDIRPFTEVDIFDKGISGLLDSEASTACIRDVFKKLFIEFEKPYKEIKSYTQQKQPLQRNDQTLFFNIDSVGGSSGSNKSISTSTGHFIQFVIQQGGGERMNKSENIAV
uniref:Uncharacterized protein n=1 Tax=Glossina pallidipes TaxID=7398 RepID=A0A1A9ZEM1_GLOPL